MATRHAASAVVIDDHGRILLVLRSKDPQRGRWSVPGGSVDEGESPPQAATREVWEETGLAVRIRRPLGVVTYPAGRAPEFEIQSFLAEVESGELQAGDDAADVRWFTAAEVLTLPLTPGLIDYLRGVGVFDDRGPSLSAHGVTA